MQKKDNKIQGPVFPHEKGCASNRSRTGSETAVFPLHKGWTLFPSGTFPEEGETLSLFSWTGNSARVAGKPAGTVYPLDIPSTVLGCLVGNGVYKDPYTGTNLRQIPKEPFQKSWWFRKPFSLGKTFSGLHAELALDGVNYRADLWLNGRCIAGKETLAGPFRRFLFDVTGLLKEGENCIALEVFPPAPGELTIGFVDWNPPAPDSSMGIFRPVHLYFNGGVSVRDPHAETKVDPETLEARLFLSAELKNHRDTPVSGDLHIEIENIKIRREVNLGPREIRTLRFGPEEEPELFLRKPRLWWPYTVGEPALYRMDMAFKENGKALDSKSVVFGIREIGSYFNGVHRGFMVNGKKILIRGGGWTDDLFLMDKPQDLESQIRYVRNMNLNTIRLEGFWGKDQTLYDLCDRYGILMMVGWSCHWEHEEYAGKPCDEKYGCILSEEEIGLISRSFRDQVLWLRNHPSIFVWTVGSDKMPKPELERNYKSILEEADPARPYLASTGGVGSDQGVVVHALLESEVSGPTGVKMLGPYDYTPPVYWYMDTRRGGAYGFNSETGPGAQVPPLWSIRKMIPEEHLWPVDEVWVYHCARNVFNTMDRCLKAVSMRYGEPSGVEDFAQKAQILNYELIRPMFEAFAAHKFMATGVIQWMLNSAWPKMYWQLYDHYLMPNGAFYGTRKACQPLHVLYRYGFHDVYITNDLPLDFHDLRVRIRVMNIPHAVLFDRTVRISVNANESKKVLDLPKIPDLSKTWFLYLELESGRSPEKDSARKTIRKADRLSSTADSSRTGLRTGTGRIDCNFYWLSTEEDVLDESGKTGDWEFYTPSKAYADFRLLSALPKVDLEVVPEIEIKGDECSVELKVHNPGNAVAFFVEFGLLKHDRDPVLPVFWDDNYISLLPDESRTVRCTCSNAKLGGKKPVLEVQGWNTDYREVYG